MKTIIFATILMFSLIFLAMWVAHWPSEIKEVPLKATVTQTHQATGVFDDNGIYVKCEDGSTGIVYGTFAPVGQQITVYRVTGHWDNSHNGLFAQPEN